MRIDYGPKHPSKAIQDTRNRAERPRHHRSRERRRTVSDTTPRGRSKSRTKTPKSQKTIKDVIMGRQSYPGNRYRMSEFWNGPKSKPVSVNLGSDKAISNNKQGTNVPDKEHKVTEKKTEIPISPQKEIHDSSKVNNNNVSIQKSSSVAVTKTEKETVVVKESQEKTATKHEIKSTEEQKNIGQEVKKHQDQKPHLYLEETETLIGTSRDYDVSSPIIQRDKEEKDIKSKSESPVSRVVENVRPASKASIQQKERSSKTHQVSKVYKDVPRSQSRVSVNTQNNLQSNSENASPYKQIPPKRTPSVASIRSKTGSTQQNVKHVSKEMNSRSETPKLEAKPPVPQRTSSRTSIQMANNLPKSSDKVSKRESKTSTQLANIVDKVLENHTDSVERKAATSNSTEKPLGQTDNNKSTRMSPTHSSQAVVSRSTVSLKPDSQVDDTKVTVKHTEIHTDEPPSVKKNVHIAEKVEVHTRVNNQKTANSPGDSDRRNPKAVILENGLDSTNNVQHHTHPYSTQHKLSASSKDNNSVYSLRTDVKKKETPTSKNIKPLSDDHKALNGHDKYVDSKVNREQFEGRRKPQGQAQSDRKRSLSNERDTLKSREHKGSVPKERKGKQTKGMKASKERKDTTPARKRGHKSRFPDIEKNDKTVSRTKYPPKVEGKRDSHIEETETETVRTLTPSEKQGAGKWRDLVQKYLREPSPVIGETEERSVLKTRIESEEDTESETDIFERARRRYALDVDDDDDDDDDDD